MDKEDLRCAFIEAGGVAVGFAKAEPVSEETVAMWRQWVAEDRHAGMDYLPRHVALKADPENVLPGASTIISLAFSYHPEEWRSDGLPYIAAYAYGDDYHDVLRKRLQEVTERLRDKHGGEWRVCVDSAPVAERYWAMRSGIGRMGRNGCVIIDGYGSMVFLAEVLTTLSVAPDRPSLKRCVDCGRCVRECPGQAILPDSTIDSRRCISYLTIEQRGEWDDTGKEVMLNDAGRRTLYGCDRCLRVCPHNRDIPPSRIEEFRLRNDYASLSTASCRAMTQEEFSRIFRRSPIKRAKLSGLLRNASNLAN